MCSSVCLCLHLCVLNKPLRVVIFAVSGRGIRHFARSKRWHWVARSRVLAPSGGEGGVELSRPRAHFFTMSIHVYDPFQAASSMRDLAQRRCAGSHSRGDGDGEPCGGTQRVSPRVQWCRRRRRRGRHRAERKRSSERTCARGTTQEESRRKDFIAVNSNSMH